MIVGFYGLHRYKIDGHKSGEFEVKIEFDIKPTYEESGKLAEEYVLKWNQPVMVYYNGNYKFLVGGNDEY